ncbi:MAG: Asp-tRNA(Asn)/Glu-tRNA(Gln) amidotransferase GatCAB subunit B, partial [Anaerolineales bacterium]|nr:Asp-tRNA(Asn)/Glu-tRNA(Gln) amidotransferase GatCAB subunit B [Anaerolineales bacterium]
YFPEPDLPPLQLSDSWIDAIKSQLPELPEAKAKRFISDFELTPSDARLLTSELSLANYFEEVTSHAKSSPKIINTWIAGEFMRNLNELNVEADSIPAKSLAQLIDMVTDKTISGNAGKVVLAELFKSGGDPQAIVKEKGLAQISDESFIQEVVTKILDDNPSEIEKYHAGKDTLLQWFVGQVARATKGKADPVITKELMLKGLEERRK